jgi:ethanolamine kinase
VGALAADVAAVRAACDALRSPTVYAHNDLLAPNLLLGLPQPGSSEGASETPPPLHVIDFEYGGYNPRGFDLGNHFNEWAGFECDYARYPSHDQQRAFLAAYAAGGDDGDDGDDDPAAAAAAAAVAPAALDALQLEANVFALASHLYWAVWALIQAKCVTWHVWQPCVRVCVACAEARRACRCAVLQALRDRV